MEKAVIPAEHRFVPEPGNQRSFRNALGAFTTGVTVVSTMTPEGPTGITVNSFASVSLDPPLVLWSVAKSSARHALFANAEYYAIHVLGADQDELSTRFTRHGQGFDSLNWHMGEENVPIIAGTLARFECRRHGVHEAGDHSIVVGRVLRAAFREGEPLCFSRGTFGRFAMLRTG
jgi:flavin reductase (DIM6/NTAB) family NADH-FMN oxidoreductase RutF